MRPFALRKLKVGIEPTKISLETRHLGPLGQTTNQTFQCKHLNLFFSSSRIDSSSVSCQTDLHIVVGSISNSSVQIAFVDSFNER